MSDILNILDGYVSQDVVTQFQTSLLKTITDLTNLREAVSKLKTVQIPRTDGNGTILVTQFPSGVAARMFVEEFTKYASEPGADMREVQGFFPVDDDGVTAALALTDMLVPKSEFGQAHLSATPNALIAEYEASLAGDKHEQVISQQFPNLPEASA